MPKHKWEGKFQMVAAYDRHLHPRFYDGRKDKLSVAIEAIIHATRIKKFLLRGEVEELRS